MNSKNEKELESQTAVERVRKCALTPCDVFAAILGFTFYTLAIIWFFMSYPGIFGRPSWWGESEWNGGHPERHVTQFLYLMTLGCSIVCVIFLIMFYPALFVTGRLIPSYDTRNRTKLLLIRLVFPLVFCSLLVAIVVCSLTLLVCTSEKFINCDCWVINGLAFYAEGCEPGPAARSDNVCEEGRVNGLKSTLIFIFAWVGIFAGTFAYLLMRDNVRQRTVNPPPDWITRFFAMLADFKELFEKVYAIDD